MLERLDFRGAPVLVTGGGTGIGQACCETLAALGASVIVCGRTEASLRETEALLAAKGAECMVSVTDVTREDEVEALREAVAERFGALKALINNAGENSRTPAADLATADWNRLLDVNLNAVFYTSRAFLPLLIAAKGGGAIVNNASIYGLIGSAGMPAYSAAKGAVLSLTRQLAVDYGRMGVRVNTVCAGPTLSPRIKGYIETGRTDPARVTANVLLGRFAECREIADATVFLASDAASYITGTALAVDGGATAH